MPPTAPRILEWYRADPWPGMKRVLVAGPSLLTFGGLVIAVSFLSGVSSEVRVDTSAAGFALIGSGALVTIFGMGRILRDDSYVAVRTDGLAVRVSGQETLVPWDGLLGVRWEPSRSALILEREGGASIAIERGFARTPGSQVAGRIEQARRRAALNMLR